MTSIRKKVIKGHRYYYLVETARINGKPKIVWQRYLGTPERLKELTGGSSNPTIDSKVFGSVASMLSVADELRLSEIIQKAVPRINLKLSVPQHIIMQGICRFHTPSSKRGSINWYNGSILPLLWGKTFSSPQTILNQFDKIINTNKNALPQIEE